MGVVRTQEVTPISKQMTIVIGLSVVGLMAFGLAVSYYRNILFDRQLILMQERNKKLKEEVVEGYSVLQYYKSEQFKDKYAKENFGLLKAGEKVLIIDTPENLEDLLIASSELTEEEKQALYEERIGNIRIIDHWRLFLFQREELEDLKRVQS